MESRDNKLRHMAQRPENREALSWLRSAPRGKQHILGTLNFSASVDLVEQVYSLGAEQVLAFEIDMYVWGENTGKIIIGLPHETSKRRDIFAWSANWAQSLGF